MKIPTLIFLCMVFICGLHGLSDAASIPTGKIKDTTGNVTSTNKYVIPMINNNGTNIINILVQMIIETIHSIGQAIQNLLGGLLSPILNVLKRSLKLLEELLSEIMKIGNNGFDLLSNVGNLLECNLLGSDKIPSSVEISTNPLGSLKAVLCFFFERIIDTIEKITNNKLTQPIGIIFENIVPSLKELLQNVLDSHILSPTYSSLIHTLLQLYNMGILLNSLSNTI
ncbi:uncharacterized protein LOC124428051 [Vespa crabro]|uniref:uncharacterized protein LOC124428051 n=1 Tax=Vespa crabro TaxID=7445 RepID=UPI001EFF6B63|nr:uncharacterized protein LOC124428051 [Vespa crabro]